MLHELITWLWSQQPTWGSNTASNITIATLEQLIKELPKHKGLEVAIHNAMNHVISHEHYAYSDTYPRLLRQSCNGVTERGLRCSRTTTITYGRNGMGFCKQHLDHVPAVYQTFIKAMESVGEEAIQRVSWTRALAESSNAGCVYFAWDGGQNLKIGYTSGAAKHRVDDIRRDRGRQTRAPSGVDWNNLEVICEIQGTVKTEKAIHNNLWRHSTEGEWFNVSADLVRSLSNVGIDLGRQICGYLDIDYEDVWDSPYDYTEDAESTLDVDTADDTNAEWVPVSMIRPKQLTRA